MYHYRAGFTIVEMIVIITIIVILATIGVVAYGSVQESAATRVVQSDLLHAHDLMEQAGMKNGGVYPTTLPAELKLSDGVVIQLVHANVQNYYPGLNAVQSGSLFADICADLVEEGIGNGVNAAGNTEDYITGCGNWNHDSMQITGWQSKVYSTPLSEAALMNYAQNFSSKDRTNGEAHGATVRNFYTNLIERYKSQGGSFPITSFFDSWATPSNGGVARPPLPTPIQTPYFCIDGSHEQYPNIKWHITSGQKLLEGRC